MAGLEPDPAKRTNALQPGGVDGGVIEQVKRAVMVSLKSALNGTTLSGLSGSDVAVEMEYPMIPQYYPGIWVQFSFTEMVNSGLGMELHSEVRDDDGNVTGWETMREFQFKGTVNLTIVALTNLERDRIAGAVVAMLMFARPPTSVITRASEDTKQFRSFISSMAENPYVSMAVNHDQIKPGGQTMTPGVPWDEQQIGYEDSYSFDILGQTNIVFAHDGTYTLRAITVEQEKYEPPTRFDWQ